MDEPSHRNAQQNNSRQWPERKSVVQYAINYNNGRRLPDGGGLKWQFLTLSPIMTSRKHVRKLTGNLYSATNNPHDNRAKVCTKLDTKGSSHTRPHTVLSVIWPGLFFPHIQTLIVRVSWDLPVGQSLWIVHAFECRLPVVLLMLYGGLPCRCCCQFGPLVVIPLYRTDQPLRPFLRLRYRIITAWIQTANWP